MLGLDDHEAEQLLRDLVSAGVLEVSGVGWFRLRSLERLILLEHYDGAPDNRIPGGDQPMRSGLRHRLANAACRGVDNCQLAGTRKTFELKPTWNHVSYRHGNWYMRVAGNWFRITRMGISPNRNDLELCKNEDGIIFPHVTGTPEREGVVSRCKIEGDLLFMDLENDLTVYWDLSVMAGDTRRMLLTMLRQQDPGIASWEGMTVGDWVSKLEGERML